MMINTSIDTVIIERIRNRYPGTTFRDIAGFLGVPLEKVQQVYGEYRIRRRRQRGRQYYLRDAAKLRDRSRGRARQIMYVNGVRVPGVRREKPNACEVCGDNNVGLLYHHWNNNKLERGIWVCYSCHTICELTDGYDGDRKDLQLKYLKLKESINSAV